MSELVAHEDYCPEKVKAISSYAAHVCVWTLAIKFLKSASLIKEEQKKKVPDLQKKVEQMKIEIEELAVSQYDKKEFNNEFDEMKCVLLKLNSKVRHLTN